MTPQRQPMIFIRMTKSCDKKTIKDLEQVCPKQEYDFRPQLLSSNTLLLNLYVHFFIKGSQKKMLSQYERFICVKTDKTINITKFTTSKAEFSTDQARLPCALYSEVWSCVEMNNSSKSTFVRLLQDRADLDFWHSQDHPSVPPLYPSGYQISCNFRFILQNIQLLHLQGEC